MDEELKGIQGDIDTGIFLVNGVSKDAGKIGNGARITKARIFAITVDTVTGVHKCAVLVTFLFYKG